MIQPAYSVIASNVALETNEFFFRTRALVAFVQTLNATNYSDDYLSSSRRQSNN